MKNYRFLLIFALINCILPKLGESANILITVVGVASSQYLVMNRLADIMGERGHNVTILKIVFSPNVKSIPSKYGKEISYRVVLEENSDDRYCPIAASDSEWDQTGSTIPIDNMKKIFGQLRAACEIQLKDENFIKTLNDSEFDLVVIHMYDYCSFGLTRVLGIDSYVWMSTAMLIEPMAWYSGSPLGHSYIPNTMDPPADRFGRLSIFGRAKNFFVSSLLIGLFKFGIVNPYTELYRKYYGIDFPDYDQILKKTQLYFTLGDPFFEYARPTSENVIELGGLTVTKAETLDEKWQKIMDEAPKEGVVIFSLGSVARTWTMPKPIKLAFLNSFKRFPHLFIWRFEGSFPEAQSVKNVLLTEWIPQKDLLAHPNLKAAIIHGGYNSITETTHTGVPVVVIPLFGDQFGNAIRITRRNVGVRLDKGNMNENEICKALEKVLYDKTIRNNATLLGRMIRERPFPALQQAPIWLEYLAKFKRLDQLQPTSHDLYLFQYLLLDIAIFTFTILFFIFAIFKCFFCFFVRKCKRGERNLKNKSE